MPAIVRSQGCISSYIDKDNSRLFWALVMIDIIDIDTILVIFNKFTCPREFQSGNNYQDVESIWQSLDSHLLILPKRYGQA